MKELKGVKHIYMANTICKNKWWEIKKTAKDLFEKI